MRKKLSAPRVLSRREFIRLSAAAATAAAAGGALSGCSGSGGGENVRLMVWSPSLDQAKDSGEWLQTCCNRFAELHPEWDITFVYGIVDETAAGTTISQDTEASADVFMFTNDVLTNLIDAGAIAKFGGIYADEIKATNSQALLDSLTVNDYIYGVPFTTNTWFMYYDKSVFTEEDIKSLDAMLAKGVVSFPFTNSWYLPAFYFGNGCTLFGDGIHRFVGRCRPQRDPGRQHGRCGSAHLHPERGGKTDVRLRRQQGHRRQRAQQVHGPGHPAGYLSGRCGSPAAALRPAHRHPLQHRAAGRPRHRQRRAGGGPERDLRPHLDPSALRRVHDNAAEQTKAMNDAMNSDGIS